jgi:hypothetical protein
MMLLKKDNIQLGLILGLVGPILGLVVIYFFKFSSVSFSVFLDEFFNNNKLITSIGSLSLLANVILFTIFINTRRDKTARGIFLVTLVFGIAILILKILN